MIEITDAKPNDIALIAALLCDEDVKEMSCTRRVGDVVRLVSDTMESEYCKVVTDAGLPIMAFGAKRFPFDPGFAFVWGFKTDLGWRAGRSVTKHIKRTMIPALRASGVSRAACLVHRENGTSCRWLSHLGFAPKATPGVGSPHRDLILYFWDDVDAA